MKEDIYSFKIYIGFKIQISLLNITFSNSDLRILLNRCIQRSFGKVLIVNNEDYIEIPSGQRLAESQTKIISDNYDTIEKAVIKYIDGYIKSANKNREHRDFDYSFSTLHNFHKELGIVKKEQKVKTDQ